MPFADLARRRLLVTLLTLAVIRFWIVYLDQPLSRLARGGGFRIKSLAQEVTWFGRSDVYLYPLTALLLILILAARLLPQWREKATSWAWTTGYLWLAVALSGLANDLVKLIAGRPRPSVGDVPSAPFTFSYDFQSFPSGHSAVAFGLALALSLLWPRGRWLFLAGAVAVAVSRVVLGAHYPADVLGGALVAWLTVLWLSGALADRGRVFQRAEDGGFVPRPARART